MQGFPWLPALQGRIWGVIRVGPGASHLTHLESKMVKDEPLAAANVSQKAKLRDVQVPVLMEASGTRPGSEQKNRDPDQCGWPS